LALVIIVLMAVTAIAAGASFLGLNTSLISKYHSRLSLLESVADAGLEEARSALNGNKALYPETGYIEFERNAQVRDAAGVIIEGVTRTTHLGPTGISSGQYGVYGSIITRAEDRYGNRVIRRLEVRQESFAKYSYFTDIERASVLFPRADILFGPVHSNDNIGMEANLPGALFGGHLSTAGVISNRDWGRYRAGFSERVPRIPYPETAELTRLQQYARAGGAAFTATDGGFAGQATMRIEFVAVDLDGNGERTGVDEGFFRVYRVFSPANEWYVVADTAEVFATNGLRQSMNCGHTLSSGTGAHSHFLTFRSHTGTTNAADQQPWAPHNGQNRFCFLGGDERLNDRINTPTNPFNQFRIQEGSINAGRDDWGMGEWLRWPGPVDARLAAARPRDAQFLWPLSRSLNPNFKGVIHVTGKVAVSGEVRGLVTVAATDNIIIVDNITYATLPGGDTPCQSPQRDILGLFSGQNVVMANNLRNSPWRAGPGSTGVVRSWHARGGDEIVHAVILALGTFNAVQFNFGTGLVPGEGCQGQAVVRGCLFLTGGIIQRSRGPVASTLSSGAMTGYLKRYQYDACAAVNPPPYFPTTGRFSRGHYFEIDPSDFNIDTYWQQLIPR
jgi:hypothetical protein